MTPGQFAYWLQGKLEGRDITQLGTEELKTIQDHLNTVFHKVTPTYTPVPEPLQSPPPPPYRPGDWPPGGYQIIC